MDPPAAELDEGQDVQGAQPGRLDAEEVAGDDPLRLGPEEVGPARSGPPRGGTGSGRPEQAADRRRPDPDPELAQLASDPDAAPAGVLPSEPEDELTDLGIDRRPSRATGPAVRPLPPDQLAVPPEQGRRGDHEGDPAVPRNHPARRREQHPVDDPELGWTGLPLEDAELMAEDQDLEVLGAVMAATLATANQETDGGADQEVEEGQHRPIVPGLSDRESGFATPTRSAIRARVLERWSRRRSSPGGACWSARSSPSSCRFRIWSSPCSWRMGSRPTTGRTTSSWVRSACSAGSRCFSLGPSAPWSLLGRPALAAAKGSRLASSPYPCPRLPGSCAWRLSAAPWA